MSCEIVVVIETLDILVDILVQGAKFCGAHVP